MLKVTIISCASYDAAGDMVCRAPTSATTCAGSNPTGAQMTYDAERRLTSWQNAPTNPTSQAWFLYDGEGHRVEQDVSGGSGNHTYYLPGNVEEVTPSGSLIKYYSAGGLSLGENTASAGSGSGISYLMSDGLGSVTEALNQTGTATASQLYSPYGGVRYSSGTMPTAKGFTGQYADGSTGLDYYGARYYDPLLGQFASADTVTDGLNRYGYVKGNPETFTDPTGHKLNCEVGCGAAVNNSPHPGGSTTPVHETGCSGGGISLSGECFTKSSATGGNKQRRNFLVQWFTTLAPGWGTAEIDFLDWLLQSGRLGVSSFWTGVDGLLLGNMWDAAALFLSGAHHASSAILDNWLQFLSAPDVAGFWKAHNTSVFAAATGALGRAWFAQEPWQEQLFINDALVDIRDATFATTAAANGVDLAPTSPYERAVGHMCDPSTHCVGGYLALFYPRQYPIPTSWFFGAFGLADTVYACKRPVMMTC